MLDLTPSQVADMFGTALILGSTTDPNRPTTITSVVTDSREVIPGSLFIAIAGENVDGHDFLDAVFADGAAAALVSRPIESAPGPTIIVPDVVDALGQLARAHIERLRKNNPNFKVVAVTGSVGKTTTKDLLGQVLTPLGHIVTPRSSFNNEIGLPITALEANTKTQVLVLEMGTDAPGNLTYLTGIAPPDIAVVLIVAGAHMEAFGSLDGVAQAKAEIVQGLRPGGTAFLNADDSLVTQMAKEVADGTALLFGESERSDYLATDLRTDTEGKVHFRWHENGHETLIKVGLVGEHNLNNALAAASVAQLLGVPREEISALIENATPVSAHRMAITDLDEIKVIDDAYNANPTSMRAALKTLADMASRSGRRSVAVLGEMLELGPDSIAEHDAIGRLVVRLNIDKLLAIGDGTRALYSGAYQEGSWGEEAAHVATTEEAREWLSEELLPGDIVLFKSSNGAGLALLAKLVISDLREAS